MAAGTKSIPGRLKKLGYNSYREYLQSSHWAKVKAHYFRSKIVPRNSEGKFCCAGCRKSGVRLEVHHLTYRRLGRERLMDFALVCRDCHGKIHKYRGERTLWNVSRKILGREFRKIRKKQDKMRQE